MRKPAKRKNSRNYYYRATTPKEVRDAASAAGVTLPAEKWITLGTPDYREAERRLALINAEERLRWDALINPDESQPAVLTSGVLKTIALRLKAGIEKQETGLVQKIEDGQSVDAALTEWRDRIVLGKLKGARKNAARDLVYQRATAWAANEAGLDVEQAEGAQQNQFETLSRLVLAAIETAEEITLQALKGKPRMDEKTFLNRIGLGDCQAKEGESLSDLFSLYNEAQKNGGKRHATLAVEAMLFDQFKSFVGIDRPLKSIEKSELRSFRDALLKAPSGWTRSKKLSECSLRDFAKANFQAEIPRSPRTVAREMSGLSNFYRWAVREGYADDNPIPSLMPKYETKNRKYPTYTEAEIRTLLASPLFKSCSPTRPAKPGNVEIRDWRYWVPLLALFTGARAGEISQLANRDVIERHGVWCLSFVEGTVDDFEQRLKSDGATRVIPLHSKILDLGFLKYCANRKGRLFPEIEAKSSGNLSDKISRFWSRHLTALKIKRRGLNMHSFRHSFIDECRVTGTPNALIGALVGHGDHSITAHYGQEAEFTIKQRHEAVEKVRFSKLFPA